MFKIPLPIEFKVLVTSSIIRRFLSILFSLFSSIILVVNTVYLFIAKIEGQINVILDCFWHEEPSLRELISFFDLLALKILETLELIVLMLLGLSSKEKEAYIEDITKKRAIINKRLLENTIEDDMAIFTEPEHTRKLVNPIN